MPKGKRRHKLTKLRERMEARGETTLSLSQKTDAVSPGRILRLADPTDDPFSQAQDYEVIQLANALACYPENLTGAVPFSPVVHRRSTGRRSKLMSIPEDNLEGMIPTP